MRTDVIRRRTVFMSNARLLRMMRYLFRILRVSVGAGTRAIMFD